MCIGKNISMLEISKVIPALLLNFELRYRMRQKMVVSHPIATGSSNPRRCACPSNRRILEMKLYILVNLHQLAWIRLFYMIMRTQVHKDTSDIYLIIFHDL